MTNLTSILLGNNFKEEITDTTHQSNTYTSLNGKELIWQNNTMPFFSIKFERKNITYQEMVELHTAYEVNYAKTFLVDIPEDKRSGLLDANMNVFAFKQGGFRYRLNYQNMRYELTVELISSTMFNYVEYDNIRVESKSYVPTLSTNTDFRNILAQIRPFFVETSYVDSRYQDNGGLNVSHLDGKFLKKRWSLKFQCTGSYLQLLSNFFSIKGNNLGTFGMWENGYGIARNYTIPTINDDNENIFFDDIETVKGDWRGFNMSDASVTRSTEQAYQGSYSIKADVTVANNGTWLSEPVVPSSISGANIKSSFWIYSDTSTQIKTQYFNDLGLGIITHNIVAAQWNFIERTDLAGSDNRGIVITATDTSNFYVDDYKLENLDLGFYSVDGTLEANTSIFEYNSKFYMSNVTQSGINTYDTIPEFADEIRIINARFEKQSFQIIKDAKKPDNFIVSFDIIEVK